MITKDYEVRNETDKNNNDSQEEMKKDAYEWYVYYHQRVNDDLELISSIMDTDVDTVVKAFVDMLIWNLGNYVEKHDYIDNEAVENIDIDRFYVELDSDVELLEGDKEVVDDFLWDMIDSIMLWETVKCGELVV